MKYIITGGFGFIGSHLYCLLKKNNNKCLIIDNMYSGVKENIKDINISDYIVSDIRDDTIDKYFNNGDILIHLAAISSLPECQSEPNEAFDVNVNGTIKLFEICRRKNVKKIIFASTSAVYENNRDSFCKESDVINPTLIYSLTKYTCENICKSYIKNYNMNISVIRFFNVYGGNQDFRRLSPPLTIYIMKELINNKRPILHSNGKQKRDYVYIDDLLKLILLVIDNSENHIVNACSNSSISVNEIFDIIKKEMNKDIQPIYISSKNFWNKYDKLFNCEMPINKNIIEDEVKKYTLGDNSYAKKTFNWELEYNMSLGLKNMVKLYIETNKD